MINENSNVINGVEVRVDQVWKLNRDISEINPFKAPKSDLFIRVDGVDNGYMLYHFLPDPSPKDLKSLQSSGKIWFELLCFELYEG